MATRPALPVLWLAASLGLGALGARLPDAHGALPPAYGGTAVLPADGALVRPLPGDALTPLAAALEGAVYDTLYTTDGNGRLVPLLAAEMPTRAGGELRITLREGLRVHGGASLTAAHVVESLWPERYLHGEAVAIGVGAALRLSVERAKLNESAAKRVIRLLSSFGLPTEVPPELSEAEMFRVMAGDKKRVGRAIHFVVMSEIGQAGSLPCKLDDELGATLLGRGNA